MTDDEMTRHPEPELWYDEEGDCLLTGQKCEFGYGNCVNCDRSMTEYIGRIVKNGWTDLNAVRDLYGKATKLNVMNTIAEIEGNMSPIADRWWAKHLKKLDLSNFPYIVEKHQYPYYFAFLKTVRNDKPVRAYWGDGIPLVLVYKDRIYLFAAVLERTPEENKNMYEGEVIETR